MAIIFLWLFAKLESFIFLTHHTKTMSCRIVVSNWEDRGWAHPPILRPPSKARIMLQVERPITLVSSNSRCLSQKPVHVCWLQGLLYASLWLVLTKPGFRFLQATVLDICDGSGRTKQLVPVSSKYQHSVILCMETLVINGVAELSTF